MRRRACIDYDQPMSKNRKQILLTNDDGIRSPGLWAAAQALAPLGFVTIAAPREQYSGSGRSLPVTSDGRITRQTLQIGSQQWTAYAIGGTPAQSVLHACLEILPQKPDLVVSGINYGENVGSGVTVSGTVGAALEAASMGIPAIAVSLQLCEDLWLTHDQSIDFSGAAYFASLFAGWMLSHKLPADMDLLKIDVPSDANATTPWRLTRLARHRYWDPLVRRENGWDSQARIDGGVTVKPDQFERDTDIRTLFDGEVTVTPLSIDMTSRLDLSALEKEIRS